MGVKGKLLTSVAIALCGLGLISEGTTAYFQDKEPTTNTFTTGVLELGINKPTIIDVKGLVPGDTVHGNFELTNDGSVDMKEILLHSSYEVIDKGDPNNGDDLGDHLVVEYIYKVNERKNVVVQKKLSELSREPIKVSDEFPSESKVEKYAVRIKFVDNGQNQNHFQEDELKLKWEFEAVQRDGDSDF